MNITMGNDEFILYVRKRNGGVGIHTDKLGRDIWIWIHKNIPGSVKAEEDQPCRWGSVGSFVDENDLPKTATQFTFDRKYLPELYTYLDTL